MKQRLLLTREKSAADAEFFADRGYDCVILPLSDLTVRELTADERLDLAQSDWVFFTSQTPVKMILSELTVNTRIACVGEKTAALVRSCGFEPDFVAVHATKAQMIAEWQECYVADHAQIFYPMSDLAEPIEIAGAVVKNVVCYENRTRLSALTELEQLLSAGKFDAVYLASPSSWQRFFSVYQNFTSCPLELIAIGKTTQAAIENDGFTAKLKGEL